jgi:hypothetical protein
MTIELATWLKLINVEALLLLAVANSTPVALFSTIATAVLLGVVVLMFFPAALSTLGLPRRYLLRQARLRRAGWSRARRHLSGGLDYFSSCRLMAVNFIGRDAICVAHGQLACPGSLAQTSEASCVVLCRLVRRLRRSTS